MTALIVSCATAIIVSFLCSVAESVLLSLHPLRLETLKKEGRKHASLWLGMKKKIDRPIAAILILNTVANTGGATIAGGAFEEAYGDKWLWLFSALFTILILLGAEVLPKVIGVAYNERLARWFGPPLVLVTRALQPLIFFTELLVRFCTRKSPPEAAVSATDLQTLAGLARAGKTIEAEQESIIINATKLKAARVESLMVLRERIAFFQLHRPNVENFELAATTLHTRYPVSRTDRVEDITGYVNFKEMVVTAPSRREVRIADFIRPLVRVRADLDLNEALKILIRRRSHIALVEDPGGRIAGLVTLEDLLEEIVGEFGSEFEDLPAEVIPLGNRRWKVGGSVALDTLAQSLPGSWNPGAPGVRLSEWLSARLGREPSSGDVCQEGVLTFTVLQTRRRKAYKVLVEATGDTTAENRDMSQPFPVPASAGAGAGPYS